MSTDNPEITILGFPKCGTSALFRCFEDDPEMQVLRTPEGSMEMSWPRIKELRPEPKADKILAHKFTAYVYNRAAVEYLTAVNPDSLLVLCVRDPARALVSWHNMHRSIAQSGKFPTHFAWKERDFYADCAIGDYYRQFAGKHLRYDEHLGRALRIIPRERLVVISQERMAEDISAVHDYLKALARGEDTRPPVPTDTNGTKHEGYADKAEVDLEPSIRRELNGVKRRLADRIAHDVTHKLF